MAKQVFRKTQGYPDRRIMHPHREWGSGILVFAVIVIVGGIFTGKVFISYLEVTATPDETGSSIPRYRESSVREAIDLYQKKEEIYTNLTQETLLIDTNTNIDTQKTQSTLVDENASVNPNNVSAPDGTVPSDIIAQ